MHWLYIQDVFGSILQAAKVLGVSGMHKVKNTIPSTVESVRLVHNSDFFD